jgi:glycosyltransferase involved in cell wall biosynthesis
MNDVAVIMSIYKNDRLAFVKLSIESVLQQSYANFDFYIQIDGVLNDDVHSYLSEITDKRVYIRESIENKGLACSLNELLLIVLPQKYEIIFRMDADDISLPQRFEKQLEFLKIHKDIDCVGAWAIEIDSKGDVFFEKEMPIAHKDCYELFKKRDCLIHPTVAFRRSFFEKAGLYPEDTYFGEDTMMWAKGFVNGCKFANIPEFLFMFRIDEHFFSRRRGWKHTKSIFVLRKRVNKLLHYPYISNVYALMYSIAKLMPPPILNLIYKISR